MSKKYELEYDPGMCLSLADLCDLTGGTAYHTMQARLQRMTVAEAVAKGSPHKLRPCICGCGKMVSGTKIYYNKKVCRRRLHEKKIQIGEIWPTAWGKCAICHKLFPVYPNDTGQFKMKETCSRSCGAILSNRRKGKGTRTKQCNFCGKNLPKGHRSIYCDNNCRDGAAEKRQRMAKVKSRAKVHEMDRAQICIRKEGLVQIVCKRYKNWIEEGFCDCRGFSS